MPLDKKGIRTRIARMKANAEAMALLDLNEAFTLLLRRLEALSDDLAQGLHDQQGDGQGGGAS